MNEALICIGSNKDKELSIILCQHLLSEEFIDISFSRTIVSSAYGDKGEGCIANFMNQLALVRCNKTMNEVQQILKNMEIQLGRTRQDKGNGQIVIDIDLMMWNREMLKPDEMKRQYVQKMMAGWIY